MVAVDWKKVLKGRVAVTSRGCWNWTGAVAKTGYGRVWYKGKVHGAHRVSYQVFRGPLRKGLYVCHKCDNRKCINPDHLFAGTPIDNTRDCMAKGRFVIARGEQRQSKLTASDVARIREVHGMYSQRELAKRFGVDKSTISRIVTRKKWRHI